MCLTVNKTNGEVKIRVASSDIPCMKIVEFLVNDEGKRVCLTPYQFAEIPPEILHGEKDFRAKADPCDPSILHITDNIAEVNGGYVHTYAYTRTSGGAIDQEISFLRRDFGCMHDDSTAQYRSAAVYKCVIPKGTRYIGGSCGGWSGYASESIRFVGKIAEFTSSDPAVIHEQVYLRIADFMAGEETPAVGCAE